MYSFSVRTISCVVILLFFFVTREVSQGASVNGEDGPTHDRVIHGERLSKKEHYHGDGEDEDEHDADYDHEAFLGADEAHEFDNLSPEESQRRLGIIVDKIDTDGDGLVTLDEMRKWIKFTQDRYISEDVERQWSQHNVDNSDTIGWEEYRHLVYGFLDDPDESENEVEDDDNFSYK